MTGELKRCCLFCETIIITTSIDKLNSEVEKHIETCKNHQKILQEQKCACGQKPKPSLIMHLKTKHFKIVGSISRFSSEGEDSNDEISDYSDNDITDDNDFTDDDVFSDDNKKVNDNADDITNDIADDKNNDIDDDNADNNRNSDVIADDRNNANVISDDNDITDKKDNDNVIADVNDSLDVIADDKNNASASASDNDNPNDNANANDSTNDISDDKNNVIADDTIDVIEIEDDDDDIPDFEDFPATNPIKEEIFETTDFDPNEIIENIHPTLQKDEGKTVKPCGGKGQLISE